LVALGAIALVGLLPTRVGPATESCAQWLSHTGNVLMLALGYGALLIYTLRRRAWGEMGVVLGTVALETAAVHLQKFAFPGLRRPWGSSGGFPSGHAAAACALAFLVATFFPRWSAWIWGVAVAISWSRLATHEHYAYQVLCGAASGYLVALLLTDRLAHRSRYHSFCRVYQLPLLLVIPLAAVLYADHRLAHGLLSLGGGGVLVGGGAALGVWVRLPAHRSAPAHRPRQVALGLVLAGILVALGLPWLAPLELLACLAVGVLAEREPATAPTEGTPLAPASRGALGKAAEPQPNSA
jgi:membrane-associated phospholipid phosphatase